MIDLKDCNEACAAMPECVECGRKKHPRGRDPGIYAASGYCGYDCAGNSKGPVAGHLWPSEWEAELRSRSSLGGGR